MQKLKTIAEQLFTRALDLPREDRTAFLEQACSRESPVLRGMVETLLQEHERVKPTHSSDQSSPTATLTNSPLSSGARLGRYLILDPLGAGGMGMVYRARDEKLEREVAVKILMPGLFSGEEARRHFRREALALAKLNHARIAAVYDVGEQDGIDYIVMELVQGESLAKRLLSGPLTVKESTSIALQVAEALEDAHERGVIHRDLKPANVMITPKGNAKVLDFGIAKLLAPLGMDATLSMTEPGSLIGTPLYMSPEQALGKNVDARTDLWSLGVLYYESLTGKAPFDGKSTIAILHAITESPFPPPREARPESSALAEQILVRALEKDPVRRYQSATEMTRDFSDLLARLSGMTPAAVKPPIWKLRWVVPGLIVLAVAAALICGGLYRRAKEKRWAREEATPLIEKLIDGHNPLAAFAVLKRAERDLPDDPRLKQIADENTQSVAISSEPSGALVEIQDYLTPKAAWQTLGVTPLSSVQIPKGYFRWRVSKPNVGQMLVAPETDARMKFSLEAGRNAPEGMVFAAGGPWGTYSAFLGWLGPYTLPSYYVDRFEVTNRQYQKFVESGGYTNPQYWPVTFQQNGRTLSWNEGMLQFRDSTGRPGPSGWEAGHYPEGQADFPVSGVSWFEAAAYAKFAGKTLPVLGEWYQTAPQDEAEYAVQLGNITGSAPAQVGTYQQLGPYGTFDTAGNVREWVANVVDDDLRFILGGSWKSQAYLYTDPEALSPFDRSDTNGFRCVRDLGPLPEEARRPYHRVTRNFASFKPVNDEVFRAYELLYAYDKTPLNAKVEGVVKETADWQEEKVSFDTAYNGERMTAYLFVPKRVKPPYQTVLFFPSARVLFLAGDSSQLGDVKFFDYIVQSGRAVMYPVYQDMYERRVNYRMPSGGESIELATAWYKDAARSLDYLATRPDIDSNRLSYLGVSMGSADGVIFSTLLQSRLKTSILLDGGYFLQQPHPGVDQADFAPRMKKPVLMVNGRYDYTFPVEKSQDPLFEMLGTPPADKSHVVLDTPHDVTEQRALLVRTVLEWLDRYLGPVKPQ
jgi:formylglycine-generating enzyme required for sulfatase activity/dienelactone hydrolase/predicted Ser/Thr protein kinase